MVLLPDALFIGFTGTPLLQADKERRTSIEIFGPYIHTYKYNEAVDDGVVLDLRYEARDINQYLSSEKKVDEWFERKTAGLTDIATARLKQRWGTMRNLFSSRQRLAQIVVDILHDMDTRDRLISGHGNALLVAGSIYEACKFYELFTREGFTQCAIVTSYEPHEAHIKLEDSGEGDTQDIEKYKIYQQMLDGRSPSAFEKAVKKQFVEEPAQMKLLIVVDKLLTGFDAPPATYLYIDKTMRDHGLFQAICRVNRLDGNDKEYGYIIDYKDLFRSLEAAVQDYTSGAFENFDADDVRGLLSNRLEKARERLELARDQIKALCEPVAPPRNEQQYVRYFCGDTSDPVALKETEGRRLDLYKYTVSFIRAFASIANDMLQAGYTDDQRETIRQEVDYYEQVREMIQVASGDKIDLKRFEPAMRQLLDRYIRAEDSRVLSSFDNMSLVELIVRRGQAAISNISERFGGNQEAVAEAIENNVRRVIIDEHATNPAYYNRMSELLDALIEARRSQAIDYENYLKQVAEVAKQVHNPAESTDYPDAINTPTKRALFDKLEDEAIENSKSLALQVSQAIQKVKKHGWRGNPAKERQIEGAIYHALENDDMELTNALFKIIRSQRYD